MDSLVIQPAHRKGFTMVEVVVALTILMVAAAAFLPVFIFAAKSTVNSNARLTATNLAQSEIEKIRAMDYDAIGTYTMISGIKVYGNPAGEIEYTQSVTIGSQTFTVINEIRWESQTASSQTDSMAYKRINVTVQNLSGFSGAQINFANMDALVSRQGERTIMTAGDLQVNVVYRLENKKNVNVYIYKNNVPYTFGLTNSLGIITFAGLTPGDYSILPDPSAFNMMVKPNAASGSGYDRKWVYSLEKTVESWVTTPAAFEVDWCAQLNLTLEDYNGNPISSAGMIAEIIPQSLPSLNIKMDFDLLADQFLWPTWDYNLRVFPGSAPDNAYDLFAVNHLTVDPADIVWNGRFPAKTGPQPPLKRTLAVMADQPTVFGPANHYQVAAPIASLMQVAVGTAIQLHAKPSFSSVLYSTNGLPPYTVWASVSAPVVPSNASPSNPFEVTAFTQAIDNGSRVLMDSQITQFRYITPGSATAPFPVTLSSATEDAQIYYTTDGSEPDETSTPYTISIPIMIDRSMTVKAAAFKNGWTDSTVVTFNYTFNN